MTEHFVSRESFAARIWRKTLEGVGVKSRFCLDSAFGVCRRLCAVFGELHAVIDE